MVGTPSLRDEYDTCPTCDCGLNEATARIGCLIADLRASRAEVERLRDALDFYANPEHWESWTASESEAFIDGGERARRALNVPLP